ncbi:hypothetical protein [Aeromicrobium sp.]|uniref:hypothetical protein n=1 Tax=Aeromicrobium sp. TaxID=1871063 RepID=UPI003C41B4A9
MGAITEGANGAIAVAGDETSLTFTPYQVRLADGTTIAHETRGGNMSAVWAVDLGGGWFAEIAHLGDGPNGGELVMTVTHIDQERTRRWVTIGALWADELPPHVGPSWPVAVDLALGLMEGTPDILPASVTKDDVEALHQRLLGALHG